MKNELRNDNLKLRGVPERMESAQLVDYSSIFCTKMCKQMLLLKLKRCVGLVLNDYISLDILGLV